MNLESLFKNGTYKGICSIGGMVVGELTTRLLWVLGEEGRILNQLRKEYDEYDKNTKNIGKSDQINGN